MSTSTPSVAPAEVDYPETDGLPMAENDVQYEWIVTIREGLDSVFRDDPDVYVSGNLFWYPIEGDNKTVLAPDALVALGRPKGKRPSYRQWEEGGVAPQVVFEILSPSNTAREMQAKREFYERHGSHEYYEFDPNPSPVKLRGWERRNGSFVEIRQTSGWVSPRLGIRFEVGDDLTIYRPDGQRFETFQEHERRAIEADRRANEERLRADEDRRLRLLSDQRADEDRRLRLLSDQRADEDRRLRLLSDQRADEERLRAQRLAAMLRAAGLDPGE
jgi:Uma2 family endonuclease